MAHADPLGRSSRRRWLRTLAGALAMGPWLEAAAQLATPWLRLPSTPDVALRDQDDRVHRLPELLTGDRPLALQFFFTGCGAVCPPQTAILRELQRLNANEPRLTRALILSISVDPLGDGPRELRRYASRFDLATGLDHGWLLLTGEPARITPVLSAFGVAGGPTDHPSLVWFGDPSRGRWTRVDGFASPSQLQSRWREVVS